ncbi:MAG: protein kinase [Anaerolineales bacterium]|nr:protein kinase [Anaerolineales bacterium]
MVALVEKTLGNYLLLEQIGRGGMSSVFKAQNLITNRIVAVKVLAPQLALDETFQARFMREAKVLIELSHPHIVPILDYGKSEEINYIVMPFMTVGSLDDRLQDGPLSVQEGAKVFDQIASALHYAHERGVIHRDIKPSNILMDGEGNAWLSDFGFAHVHDATVSLTGSALIGTPAYMAPEQVLGHPVSELSDQYSLGVVLYQMCTGALPHDAETPMALALKHANEPLRRPRLVNPNLPDAVESVLIKTLAKDPLLRFRSVAQLNQVFQQALHSAVDLDAGALKAGARSQKFMPRDDSPVSPVSPVPPLPPISPVDYSNAVVEDQLRSTRRSIRAAILLLMLVLPLTCWVTVNAAPQLLSILGVGRQTTTASPFVDNRATADVISTDVVWNVGPSQSTDEVKTAVAATLTAMVADASHTPEGGLLPTSTEGHSTATERSGSVSPTSTPGGIDPPGGTENPPTATHSPTPTQTLSSSLSPTVPPPTTTTGTTPTEATPTNTITATIIPTKTITVTPTTTKETLITPTLPPIVTTTTNVPADPCDRVGVGGFSVTNRRVEWKIGNGKSSSIRLVNIYIEWPLDNKSLVLVTLSGKILWSGIDDNPPTSIDLPSKGSGDNVIPPSSIAPLVFTFSVDAKPSDYELVLLFGNGCKIAVEN